jgi:putative FmdB family regulatory protein
MPTYDYECGACGHEFELFQQITANPVRKCPKCGAIKVKRLIGSGGAILFKGSGFYTTDYRSDDYKQRASADKSPASPKAEKVEKSEGKKSETKKSPGGKKSD